MSCYGLSPSRHFVFKVVCILASVSIAFCALLSHTVQPNVSISTGSVAQQTGNATRPPAGIINVECNRSASSCSNCSQLLNCAWCFSEKICLPKYLRDHRHTCEEDDWYYGDCDKPEKETVLVYVLLSCALFLLLIVILLVLYIFFCKMPRTKDYEPVSQKDKKKQRRRTPLMSKKVKPSASRTDELKKKYQLDG